MVDVGGPFGVLPPLPLVLAGREVIAQRFPASSVLAPVQIETASAGYKADIKLSLYMPPRSTSSQMEGDDVAAVPAEAGGSWERSSHTSQGLLDRLPLLIC